MTQRNQKTRNFSFGYRTLVVALADNPSRLGAILSSQPPWLLREADRRAEQDCAKSRGVQLPNPWECLINAPCVSAGARQVFVAAQSFLFGLQRLCRMAEGFASLNSDWSNELATVKSQGKVRLYETISRKLAKKFVLSPFIRKQVQAQKNPELLAEMEALHSVRKAQIVHRSRNQRVKAEAFDPILKLSGIKERFPLELCLVESWLCFPLGPSPGLMFWSNKAITQWWFLRTGRSQKAGYKNLGLDYVKKTRQRLGLKPVSEKSPIVWNVRLHKATDNNIEISGWNRKGEMVFKGKFPKEKPGSTIN